MISDLRSAGATVYLGFAREAMPRLLGTLDRESLSPTRGSFDRDHWAWKFRDFPITMLQAGVLPLAWWWRTPAPDNPWYGRAAVHEWIQAALGAILDRQHRNGAFDTVAPNSQDHGVTLAQCYVLATTADLLGEDCPSPLAERIANGLRRGAAFAARSSEDYAFITNHQALFALTWHRLGQRLSDAALGARAEAVVAAIVAHQSPDGWFAEYGGPDPGYETLGLQHLAQLAEERPDPALSGAIDRSLAFLAHCVQPDGGLGGGWASRHTRQWYPAGLELLAERSETARALADFLRPRLVQAPVVTPQTVDAHNLPLLLHSYCLAATAVGRRNEEPRTVSLPCEAEAPLRYFPDAGVVFASTPSYYAACGLRKGGVLAVVGKSPAVLVHEDAGYVAQTGGPGRRWSSALLGLTVECDVHGAGAMTRARFGLAPRPVLTPWAFLLLRCLNLTLFRSVWLGARIRRMIIARLITGRRPGRLQLERRLSFEADRVVVEDAISGGDRSVASLWRPRAFTAVHMGSARYYHPQDLADLPEPLLAEAARHLAATGAVTLQYTIDGRGDRPTVPPASST